MSEAAVQTRGNRKRVVGTVVSDKMDKSLNVFGVLCIFLVASYDDCTF